MVVGALLATVSATATVLVRHGGNDEGQEAAASEVTPWERSWRANEGFTIQSGQLTTLWAESGLVALVGEDTVQALDPATGEPSWTLETPAEVGGICAASATVNAAGLAAVAYRDAEHNGVCVELAIVDTADGQLVWRQRLVDTSDIEPADESANLANSWMDITLADDWVGVRVSPEYTTPVPYAYHRLDLASGAQLPTPWPPDDCRGHSWAISVERSAISYNCGETDDEQRNENNVLTVFDSATGEELWTRPVRELGGVTEEVLADEPLTLLIGGEATTFDSSGEVRQRVSVQGHFIHPRLVGDTALESAFGEDGRSGFAGHDLETGELRWRHDYAGAPDAALDLGDGRLLVLQQRGELTVLDLTEGTETSVGQLPSDYDHMVGYALTDTTLYLAVKVQALESTVAIDAYPLPSAVAPD